MILLPTCKINLGLHILQKRADGFHDLETVFYPVALQDALEIIHHPDNESSSDIVYSSSGNILEVKEEDNICIKAYHLLKKDFPQLPPVQMHLHKNIPVGAGLGGGSADGAFTLMLLNKKFNLQLGLGQLMQYAAQLGSDCAFFIKNKSCYATGRGEILEDISIDLSDYKIILVYPQIHINTGWAFAQITPDNKRKSLKEIIKQPVDSWKDILVNDFEIPIFKQYPDIKNIKETLYDQGAIYAAMSGSGSTVFGLFAHNNNPSLQLPASYFVKEMTTFNIAR